MVKKHTIQRPSWPTLRWSREKGGKLPKRGSQQCTPMSGADQLIWNMVNDQDLFCIWGIASLTEPLQDKLIEKSLKYLLQIIPILNARPITTWCSGRWQFPAKENVADLIDRVQTDSAAETEAQLQKIFNTPINAEDGVMIRLYSIDSPETHHFVIQVHHLVMDGEGVKRVCAKFAEIYRGLFRHPGWKPDCVHLPCRSHAQLLRHAPPVRLFTAIPAYLISLFISLSTKAVSSRRREQKSNYQLLNTEEKSRNSSPLPSFSRILFEEEVMQQALDFTKNRKTTIHTLLMASFSLAIMAWNTERGDMRTWLRFFHTANLRRWWGEPNGTFANFSVVLQHKEIFTNLQSPAQALAATEKKLNQAKKHIGIDAFFISMLLHAFPYLLIRRYALILKKKTLDFARHNQAMTNIGIIPKQVGEFGHTTAQGYSLLAPAFPGGCQLFTMSTYKNVMTISLGCSEDALSKEDARAFLRLWKEKFLEVIAER